MDAFMIEERGKLHLQWGKWAGRVTFPVCVQQSDGVGKYRGGFTILAGCSHFNEGAFAGCALHQKDALVSFE